MVGYWRYEEGGVPGRVLEIRGGGYWVGYWRYEEGGYQVGYWRYKEWE